MDSLEDFIESLTQEQDKLILMGTIKLPKDQDLVNGYSKVDSKGNNNSNKPRDKKKWDKSKSHEESSNSKKKNFQKKKGKGEGSKCAYCGKVLHLESSYMKKKINMLKHILYKKNISLPDGAKNKEGWSSFKDK